MNDDYSLWEAMSCQAPSPRTGLVGGSLVPGYVNMRIRDFLLAAFICGGGDQRSCRAQANEKSTDLGRGPRPGISPTCRRNEKDELSELVVWYEAPDFARARSRVANDRATRRIWHLQDCLAWHLLPFRQFPSDFVMDQVESMFGFGSGFRLAILDMRRA